MNVQEPLVEFKSADYGIFDGYKNIQYIFLFVCVVLHHQTNKKCRSFVNNIKYMINKRSATSEELT